MTPQHSLTSEINTCLELLLPKEINTCLELLLPKEINTCLELLLPKEINTCDRLKKVRGLTVPYFVKVDLLVKQTSRIVKYIKLHNTGTFPTPFKNKDFERSIRFAIVTV